MRKIRLDIGGPKGNAWYIISTVKGLCRSMGMDDSEAKDICAEMRGDVFEKLGGKGNDYEGLLRVYLNHFPFVELYATHDVGIDPELYTLDENPEIYEL